MKARNLFLLQHLAGLLPLLGILFFCTNTIPSAVNTFKKTTTIPELIRTWSVTIGENATFPPETLPIDVIEMVKILREKNAPDYLQSPGFEKRFGKYQQRLVEGAWPIRYRLESIHGYVVHTPDEKQNYASCTTLYEGKENTLVYCP